MENLILNSLEIKNFRAFRHLRIERLGRVNLITGKNNVGKTTLLEALYLYARGASPYQLLELLETRDEMRERRGSNSTSANNLETEPHLPEVNDLFYGRKKITENQDAITIGPIDSDHFLGIAVRWLADANLKIASTWQHWFELPPFSYYDPRHLAEPCMGIKTRLQEAIYCYPVHNLLDRTYNIYQFSSDTIISPFIRTQGGQTLILSMLWDKVTLTPEEDYVLEALRIISPDIQRVGFIGEDKGDQRRIPVVRLSGNDAPVPMRSLGDGLNRIFAIVLALIGAKDGFLLIDEVENGLHYSIMPEMWRLIFKIANRLNVQVFAATHSWDCVKAFQKASKQDEHEEAILVRLVKKKEDIVVALFDEEDLDVATHHLVEVR